MFLVRFLFYILDHRQTRKSSTSNLFIFAWISLNSFLFFFFSMSDAEWDWITYRLCCCWWKFACGCRILIKIKKKKKANVCMWRVSQQERKRWDRCRVDMEYRFLIFRRDRNVQYIQKSAFITVVVLMSSS